MKFLLSLIFLLFSITTFAATKLEKNLDVFYKRYVKEVPSESFDTKVNYPALRKDLKRNKQLKSLHSEILKDIAEYDITNKSKDELISFYINAYNFLTIDMIIKNYRKILIRIPSILVVDLPRGPWDSKIFDVAGEKITLNGIEQGKLRGELLEYSDARIHFALNCASKSCPPLLDEAFTAEKLNEQLTRLTKSGLKLKKVVTFKKGKTYLSNIFKWYSADYENEQGSINDFLKFYSDGAIEIKGEIKYQSYNWFLNILPRRFRTPLDSQVEVITAEEEKEELEIAQLENTHELAQVNEEEE